MKTERDEDVVFGMMNAERRLPIAVLFWANVDGYPVIPHLCWRDKGVFHGVTEVKGLMENGDDGFTAVEIYRCGGSADGYILDCRKSIVKSCDVSYVSGGREKCKSLACTDGISSAIDFGTRYSLVVGWCLVEIRFTYISTRRLYSALGSSPSTCCAKLTGCA